MSVHSDTSGENNNVYSNESIPPSFSQFSVFAQTKKEVIRLTYLDNPSLVCDNGTHSLKVGFGGDDSPRSLIPTFVGSPRKEVSMIGYGQRNIYVGDYAVENRGVLNVSNPMQNGIITDWEAMEQMYYHMYYENLTVPPESYNIIHTEAPLNPKGCREKLAEMMFELFNVPGMFTVPSATAALFGNGKTTGIVVDSGYECTRAVPIYEGYILPHAVRTLPVGGKQVTEYLASLMNARGFSLTTPKDIDITNAIKEKLCYCVANPSKEHIPYHINHPDYEQSFILPDGQTFTIYSEAFRATEILFDPNVFKITSKIEGVHKMIHESIGVCDIRLQNDMYQNVILAGGNTLFPSIQKRMERMLAKLALSTTKIRIIITPERKFSAWIGGSIVATLSTFQHMWVNRAEYEEHGPKSVHHKCF
ncbi:uncharacterized protein LOC126898036 [Daktulosphaira vitifoliae]|uniref:uncharacterized protein LOC126898036 n=1 Tax=Daktulosphaira vitifoliae TaxID=58002 RepID=UPI0021AAA86A|nr:uncharacterized protein LOC126898036 [Daktulosphaira vitifoliae]